MAEETLVKEVLTEDMIRTGASIIEALDRQNLIVDAALWLYLADTNRWRLMLASPEVHIDGPRRAYTRLFHAIRNANVHGVSLDNLAVIDSQDPFIQLLRRAIKTDRVITPPVRFSKNTINGQFIEDALIYRLAA
ncbi:MAG TPA: hypothetical protein VNA69_21915 [Thermoanaerobaculia bacterium]|nr:hypothetical protein [Thermoanaerobaculia bacterium]